MKVELQEVEGKGEKKGKQTSESIEETTYKYAVKNAFLHKGKAEINAVVGKVIALHKGIKLVHEIEKIKRIVGEVNKKDFETIKREFEGFQGKFELKPKEKKSGLPDLKWTVGKKTEKVITRFAPNPNGPFHLGSARAALFSYWFAEKHNGKFILRFDDTDPKVKKPIENAEKIFREDLEWLGCKIDEVFFASNRLQIYYKFIAKLIGLKKAYVCTCKSEEWKKLCLEKKACSCRNEGIKEQSKKWQEMLDWKLKEGQAVVRVKTDLKHKDPSVRDWVAARIVDDVQHSNEKARNNHVWPTYNFSSAIDDHELGVTLILRGQEHEQNQTKQEFVFKYLKWKYPKSIHFGRVKISGFGMLSTSKVKEAIEKGELTGWDDPRTGTIKAFKRRGFSAEALKKAIMEIGVKGNDTTISIEALCDLNRKEIDAESDRLVFISDEGILEVEYSKKLEVKIPVHPDVIEKGNKTFELKEGTEKFIVSKKELGALSEGKVFRLRNAYNVKLKEKKGSQAVGEFVGIAREEKLPTLQWLLPENSVNCEITMPDASKKTGVVESMILDRKIGERFYLEKFGYARLDEKSSKLVRVWYAHR